MTKPMNAWMKIGRGVDMARELMGVGMFGELLNSEERKLA